MCSKDKFASAAAMDIRVLQKSSTFTSLSTTHAVSTAGVVSTAGPHPAAKAKKKASLGAWFDRRARKITLKCSRSITLGKEGFS